MHKLVRQGAQTAAYLKISPSLGQIFKKPQFQKFQTTDIAGVYMACKFNVDIPKGCGDIFH